ncbi:hypothetical protein PPYR_00957 [Photinus pyralis]|uniref:Antistasin-like domain-containing protein n=1 Tax=Photinus pyralis TaxID=7054 RepID=A0A1Y1NLI1_PHOPY|nr:keratin-associated protein 16-1-like [Photinus pyralis]KAB0803987.1 hypothetical protein PPYR_00957 [Photinus pyralis]
MYFFAVLIFHFTYVPSQSDGYIFPIGFTCNQSRCDEYCPYGYKTDVIGCRTCTCDNPCAGKQCEPYQQCDVDHWTCHGNTYYFSLMCRASCPLHECKPQDCPYGHEKDEMGCKGCGCMNPCKYQRCGPGEVCVAEEMCSEGPRGIKLKCLRANATGTKQCEELPCHSTTYCQFGFAVDSDNCPTCTCITNLCSRVVCPLFHYCTARYPSCRSPPCPAPSPKCKPICPKGTEILVGMNDFPVECNDDEWICPKKYDCLRVNDLSTSYCCKPLEEQ